MNDSPRSPLNWLQKRRSLEPTFRQPSSQSSKLITPFNNQVFSNIQVIVFQQRRKPAHFKILEVLLDECDPKTLAVERCLRELCPRLANRIGSKLIDEPRVPTDSLL